MLSGVQLTPSVEYSTAYVSYEPFADDAVGTSTVATMPVVVPAIETRLPCRLGAPASRQVTPSALVQIDTGMVDPSAPDGFMPMAIRPTGATDTVTAAACTDVAAVQVTPSGEVHI